jgi:glycosyltransferase involved in cell wall biosynthesis
VEAVATTLDRGATPAVTRVLLVSSRASGGMARHLVALMAGLQGQGYELAVACDPEGVIAQAARERSLPVYALSLDHSGNPPRAMVAAWHLSAAVTSFGAHVVHTHSFQAGLVGAVGVPLARTAHLVSTIHGYPPLSRGGSVPGRAGRLAVRMILKRATRVIMVSGALKRDLLRLRPRAAERTVVIPNGVELLDPPACSIAEARAAYGLPAEAPLIGLVARLAPQKGVPEFLHMARGVADRFPAAHFVVVGDGPGGAEAVALRDELGLTDRLHLLGRVEPAREVMWGMDVLVVSSTSEGSSIVAMEAMALGRPVVGTAVGGVPEVIAEGETGLVVPPGDPQALAEAVGSLLADPERAQEMGARGRQRVAANFDLELMIERTKGVYADVMRIAIESSGRRR